MTDSIQLGAFQKGKQMKAMSWKEIDKDWAGLQKRHRLEIGQAVARYCVGHSIQEVAEHLGYSRGWVQQQLNYAGIAAATALGGATALAPVTGGAQKNVNRDVDRLVKEYAPSEEEMQSEEFQPYRDHYESIYGQDSPVAQRLAKAEWAAEAAIEDGVLKESTNKRNEKVNQILFPDDQRDSFELDLKFHMSRVEAAARFIDVANMRALQRKSTRERVASTNEKWVEQVDRILNLHDALSK